VVGPETAVEQGTEAALGIGEATDPVRELATGARIGEAAAVATV